MNINKLAEEARKSLANNTETPKQHFERLVGTGLINSKGQLTTMYGGDAEPEHEEMNKYKKEKEKKSEPKSKYIVQVFVSDEESKVGFWEATAWSSSEAPKMHDIAENISQYNRQGITKVRVLEILEEIECINVEFPRKRK